MTATVHIYRQMCTVAVQLKIIALAPLQRDPIWYFGGAKIALQLFSSTATNALETKSRVAKKIQNKRKRKWWYATKISKKRQRKKWGVGRDI